MLSAIIVAGGSGRRMGFDKTFAPLNDRPVLAHAIAAFEQADCVAEIIVVGRRERLPEIRGLVARNGFAKVTRVVVGGIRRQDSVKAGLEQISESVSFVAVHDAARPIVSPALIDRTFAAAQKYGGAACALPVSDTLKRANDEGFVVGSVDRERLFAVQTPQIFERERLLRAYAAVYARKLEVTDEVSAVEQLGQKVFLLPNNEPNFKITYPSDLAVAEFILRQRSP